MAFFIPKIQYLNKTIFGATTSGSATLSSLPTVVGLQVGMIVKGAGVPVGATLLSIATNTAVMSANATATAAPIGIDFYFEIVFQFPPVEPGGPMMDGVEVVSTSLSGIRQTVINYIEETRALNFSFLSQAIYLKLMTFIQTHAIYGRYFRYFEDQNSVSYIDYEMNKLKSAPKKIAGKGENAYVWSLPFELRRTL